MKRVLVVCSVHRETGRATPTELHWLLGRLKPDALFLERSATRLAELLDGTCQLLESVAVRHYCKDNTVALVPVDLAHKAGGLKVQFDYMFDRIEATDPRLCALQQSNLQRTEAEGFAYLNSPLCVAIQFEIEREMRAAVEAIDEPALTEIYARWVSIHASREQAMFHEVESFARKESFEKGVLLLGAAHSHALTERSRQIPNGEMSPVTWDFDWQHELMVPEVM